MTDILDQTYPQLDSIPQPLLLSKTMDIPKGAPAAELLGHRDVPVMSCTLAFPPAGLLPFGQWQPSAFPSIPLKDILLSTTLPISGLNHAACILVPSSSVRPLLSVHVDITPDLLARLWSGGT